MPAILDIFNLVIFRKNIEPSAISAYKNMVPVISNIKASIIRGFLEIAFLPNKAYVLIVAIVKAIYRMTVSGQNLLEWMTSEEAEKQSKTDLKNTYKFMWANILIGLILLITSVGANCVRPNIYNMFITVLGIFWIFAPILAWHISKETKELTPAEELTQKDKQYILEVGAKTWEYFEDFMNEENNYLVPDNYQEDRKEKIAPRTSSTNIGLGLLSVISAYDLKYIELEEAINLIAKGIETINKLTKWNGHLYNWYNTKTLEPLMPRFISTVDSGNFVGYLYTLKQFLIDVGACLVCARAGTRPASTGFNKQYRQPNSKHRFHTFI